MLARVPWVRPRETKPRARRLNRDRRRRLIEITAEILRQGFCSKFEQEGACRHGLRAGFCLDGWGWADADAAAADIVATALRFIGAQRPSWKEGQPEWTQDGFAPVEYTRCQHCHGKIPPDRGSRNGPAKYCSDLCGQAAYARKAYRFEATVSRAEYLAELAARTAKTMRAEKDCEHCGKVFRPGYNISRQRFCSRQCADAGKPNPRRLPERPCVGCGNMFKPRLADRKYCSSACYQGRGLAPVRGVENTCPVCKTIFRVHSAALGQVHCSKQCARVTRWGPPTCEAAE